MVDVYTPVHQGLLQTLVNKGSFLKTESEQAFADLQEILGEEVDKTFDEAIGLMNARLAPVNIEIRGFRCDRNGAEYYSLINKLEDSLSEVATEYLGTELEYFSKIVNHLVQETNSQGQMNLVTALNLRLSVQSTGNAASSTQAQGEAGAASQKASGATSTVARLGQAQAEALLNRFVADGWLEKTGSKCFALSRRGRADLHYYLERIADDCPDLQCTVCQDVVVIGQGCATPNCGVRMHHFCAADWFKKRAKPECPSCKRSWEQDITQFQGALGVQGNTGDVANPDPEPPAVAARRKRQATDVPDLAEEPVRRGRRRAK